MAANPIKNEPFDQPGPLMIKTRELLQDKDLFAIYADTKLSPYWLRKFAKGELKNPSVNRVEFLYNYLTKK